MLRWAFLVFSVACASSAPAPHSTEHAHDHPAGHEHGSHDHAHGSVQHDFSDAARWSKQFDDPARDAWQKPDEVVKLAAIEPGMTVVDLGAGTGYFARRLSTAAGPSGKVLALDPEPNLVTFMRARFEKEGLTNAEARACPTDGTGLAPASVDRVLVVDTWHHIEGRDAYTKHLASVLRPGGLLVVVDFTLETKKGPPPKHRIAPDALVAELAAGGFDAKLAEETLPDQYVIVAQKPAP